MQGIGGEGWDGSLRVCGAQLEEEKLGSKYERLWRKRLWHEPRIAELSST